MSERHRNPKNMQDEYKRTLDLLEQQDLKTESFPTETDFEPLGKEDLEPSEFTEKGTDSPSDEGIDSNPELPVGDSMSRFCKKHDVPESAKVTGQQSSGLPKVAKTDSPSDEG